MGYVRFLLAATVVAYHSANTTRLPTIGGLAAVEAFLLISGFYMAAAYLRNYKGRQNGPGAFLLSRFLRLYPFYFFVLMATWAFWLTGIGTNHQAVLTFFNEPTAWLAALNLSMLGLDIVSIDQTQHLHIVARPAWSISAELVFYALVPLLCVMRKWLAVITVAAFAFKAYLEYAFGWRVAYFPFFGQIGYFTLGMLLYFYREKLTWSAKWAGPLVILFAAYVLLSPRAAFEDSIIANLGLTATLALILPTCFEHDTSKLSSFLGDLSYGVYLVHVLIVEMVFDFGLFGPRNPSLYPFFTVLAISVLVASLFEICVQGRLDAWRRRMFYAHGRAWPTELIYVAESGIPVEPPR